MESDYNAIRAGIKTAPNVDYNAMRIVRIKNTLRLDEMEISEALVKEAKDMPNITGDWTGYDWVFDKDYSLLS